jgi:hemerythrin superfamily protein
MTKRPEAMPETDAVGLLLQQHQRIRRLFQEVEQAEGDKRAETFEWLCRFLAVHERTEEEIVHPVARLSVKSDKVIDARLEEENEGKMMLQVLEKMGPSAQGFGALFAEFRTAVLEHAEHEEREEFPELKTRSSAELHGLAAGIKAAEATVPNHPHPGAESATKNVLVGSYAAVADRIGDGVRKVMGRDHR